jgi:hypothetical protein
MKEIVTLLAIGGGCILVGYGLSSWTVGLGLFCLMILIRNTILGSEDRICRVCEVILDEMDRKQK